jgi:hypothetical protein
VSVADVLQAIATATFVGAFGFGVVQVFNARRLRREQAAIEIIHSMQNGPFARAWRTVVDLPSNITAEEFERRGSAVRDAADDMGLAFETLGYLVYKRVVPLEIAEDLVGMMVTATWERLRPWAELSRKRADYPPLFEWYQWLAERLAGTRGPLKQAGAYTAFREWKP